MLKQILEVFTKQYREETKYQEFLKQQIHQFKLNDDSEDINDVIQRLSKRNFVSNFKI